MQELFTSLTQAVEGAWYIAVAASFLWGGTEYCAQFCLWPAFR
jgi:hypothetical protein